ncbi:Histidine kinase-, DNA gyrase B-, and HSP90-like ATPase [Streptomyces sp. LamerLS-316]|uniref:ATP-binding protein n=1 Tax=unclassified Streptomyces TaxID=2593676 RepID=UPI000823A626|nr:MULTISPECIES: ATP-binding protein [unclassified Streptomyces]MYQ36781.1 sensor histidine kinase [Streptomyces sp. SID4921]SCK51062.1 Histidine kinase-, DNA gyrase B-, and HSP90-like ATPase [Streptomyces sp. LamerLS-316]
MTTPLRDLLATWPGRFRHRAVLLALADGTADPDREALGYDILDGFGGREPVEVYERLVHDGEFTAAEAMLLECAELDDPSGERWAALLAARDRADEVARLEGGELMRRAEAAGLEMGPDEVDEFAAAARRRQPEATLLLKDRTEHIDRIIDDEAEILRARIAARSAGGESDAQEPHGTAADLEALLKTGQLSIVRSRLAHEPPTALFPEAVPPLWPGDWRKLTPQRVLDLIRDETAQREAGFARWKPADQHGRELLDAYAGLEHNHESSAVRFAAALATALCAGGTEPRADRRPDGDGFVTSLDGLFAEEPLRHFHTSGRIDLFIARPDVREIPADLTGRSADSRPWLALGPDLEPSGYLGRTHVAVVSLRDLLRLASVRERRAVLLLRLIARQWPLDALTGSTVQDFRRVLATDRDAAWQTLRWILDLTGAGDAVAADAMASCTGMDPGLLLVMLRAAVRPDRVWPGPVSGSHRVEPWEDHPQLVGALEAELLGRCTDTRSEAALWAALVVAGPDGSVTEEDMCVIAEAVAGGRNIDAAIAAGTEILLANGTLGRTAEGELTLRNSALERRLRQRAEAELATAVERLSALPAAPVAESAVATEIALLTGWAAHRHLLTPSYAAFRELAGAEGTEAGELLDRARTVLAETASSDPVVPVGTAALDTVLTTLTTELRSVFPEVHVDVRCPENTRVAVADDALRVVFHELLDNAAEALSSRQGGAIRIDVGLQAYDAVVDVRDSGPGFAAEVRGRERTVFREGYSTRGTGRGASLSRVMRILQMVRPDFADISALPSDTAPSTLRGAHFRVVLPLAGHPD